MFVDTHAHINDKRYTNLDETVKFARDMGVKKIIASGNDIKTSEEVVMLAEKYPEVYATIGVHPQDVEGFSEKTIDKLKALAKHDKVVGIGEIGLEYREGATERELQKDAFRSQIMLAQELGLPIVIHSRDAIADTLDVLKGFKNLKGAFHCFSESAETAKIVLSLGLYISVGGVVTFKNGRKLQEVVKDVPLECILLETDCPYLTPEPYRGKLNQSGFIPFIAEKIAQIKEVEVNEVASVTTENVRRLFNI